MQKNRSPLFNEQRFVMIVALVVAIAMFASYIAALATFSGENKKVEMSDEDSYNESENSENEKENTDVSDHVDVSEEAPKGNYQYYDKIEFENTAVDNSGVVNGSLAIIKNENTSFPVIGESALENISTHKSDVYGLSGFALKLYKDAILGFDEFIVSFFNEVPQNGLIIDKAYLPHTEADAENGTIDLCSGYSVRFSIFKSSYAFSDAEFSYLRDQAYRYGVIQRYPEGKKNYTGFDASSTIYRYVGKAHSWYMNYYKICLEEYIDKLRTEGVVEFKSGFDNNKAYVVYYVPVDAGSVSTQVPLPAEGYKYEISGDGAKGFIVTVEVPVA